MLARFNLLANKYASNCAYLHLSYSLFGMNVSSPHGAEGVIVLCGSTALQHCVGCV